MMKICDQTYLNTSLNLLGFSPDHHLAITESTAGFKAHCYQKTVKASALYLLQMQPSLL